jgi:hypothetical protein
MKGQIARYQALDLSDLAAGAEPSQPDCNSPLLQEVHSLFDVDGSWVNRE